MTDEEKAATATKLGLSEDGFAALLGLDDVAIPVWDDFIANRTEDLRAKVPAIAGNDEPVMGLSDETMAVATMAIGRIMLKLALNFPIERVIDAVGQIASEAGRSAITQAAIIPVTYEENGEEKTGTLGEVTNRYRAQVAANEAARAEAAKAEAAASDDGA